MKKIGLFVLSFLFLTSLVWGDVFMTELADPNNNADARYIELYNNGASAVNFTDGVGWAINKYTNGSATVSSSISLTGSIAAGGFYLVSNNGATFTTVYGFAPDYDDASLNGTAGSNGDDTLELFDGTGAVVDFYGVQPIIDLTPTVWEWEDGRAERANGATTGTNPPVDADWNTWSDGPGGDTQQTQDAPADFDPGAWIGTGANALPSISNVTQTPSSGINSSTSVSVSANITDSDGTISLAELHWGTATGSLGTTITMSLDTGDTYVTDTDIPAQSDDTTVYYEVYAEDNIPESKTSLEYNYYVSDAVVPDFVINEILADPDLVNGDANGDGTVDTSQDEFVEIVNREGIAIDISGWEIHDGYSLRHTIPASTTIQNDQALVVFGGGSPHATIPGIVQTASEGLLGFNNTGDDVILKNSSGQTVVSYTYGGEGGDNQSIARNPDFTGGFVKHSTIGTNPVLFSPGKKNVDDSPLPVTLSSFTASFSNSTPIIHWVTESESDNLGWNVYRANSSNLGQASILNLNTIPGNGTTTEPSYYSFVDEYEVQENFTYWYWLESIAISGETEMFGPVALTIPLDDNHIQEIPIVTELHQNFPNPFNPNTSISFDIKEGEDGVLTVYNIKGQLIEKQMMNAGEHTFEWDGTAYGSGVYFYKLETNSYTETKKMIMLK